MEGKYFYMYDQLKLNKINIFFLFQKEISGGAP